MAAKARRDLAIDPMVDRTPEAPSCPITGSDDVRRVGTWSASEIGRLWREDIGIDVGALFAGREVISLWHSDKADLQFFHPIVTGGSELYTALREKPWYVQPDRWEFREAAAQLTDAAQVLDLGAGTQAFRAYIADGRYSAIDPHTDGQVPDAEPRFDALCAFQVLEHAPDPLHFITEATSWLRPDGRLFIGVPNRESYLGRLKDFPLDMPPHHVTRWSRRALAVLAEEAGLTVETIAASPLEPWEAPLYWMSRVERRLSPQTAARSRWARIAAYGVARVLTRIAPVPRDTAGGTLLLQARVGD